MVLEGDVTRTGHSVFWIIFPLAGRLLLFPFRAPQFILEYFDPVQPVFHMGAVYDYPGGVPLSDRPGGNGVRYLHGIITAGMLPGFQFAGPALVVNDLVFRTA